MFENCESLIDLDLGNFVTSSITDMHYIFSNYSSLTTLNLSSFDTSFVSNMTKIFDGYNISLLYCINNKENYLHEKLSLELIKNLFLNNNCPQLCVFND